MSWLERGEGGAREGERLENTLALLKNQNIDNYNLILPSPEEYKQHQTPHTLENDYLKDSNRIFDVQHLLCSELQRESQNYQGWKISPRLSSPTTPPALPRPAPNLVPKCHIHGAFEPFQTQRFHHCPGQPVPVGSDRGWRTRNGVHVWI